MIRKTLTALVGVLTLTVAMVVFPSVATADDLPGWVSDAVGDADYISQAKYPSGPLIIDRANPSIDPIIRGETGKEGEVGTINGLPARYNEQLVATLAMVAQKNNGDGALYQLSEHLDIDQGKLNRTRISNDVTYDMFDTLPEGEQDIYFFIETEGWDDLPPFVVGPFTLKHITPDTKDADAAQSTKSDETEAASASDDTKATEDETADEPQGWSTKALVIAIVSGVVVAIVAYIIGFAVGKSSGKKQARKDKPATPPTDGPPYDPSSQPYGGGQLPPMPPMNPGRPVGTPPPPQFPPNQD